MCIMYDVGTGQYRRPAFTIASYLAITISCLLSNPLFGVHQDKYIHLLNVRDGGNLGSRNSLSSPNLTDWQYHHPYQESKRNLTSTSYYRPYFLEHCGQYHLPSGGTKMPTHSKWNHSRRQPGASQPIISLTCKNVNEACSNSQGVTSSWGHWQ